MESLILVSISLATVIYVLGFIMLFTYKRDKIKQIDERLDALNNILDSCDKMIDELNNLSDYIISNIEEKSNFVNDLTHEADKRIKELHFQIKTMQDPRLATSIMSNEKAEEQETKKKTKKTKKEIERIDEPIEQIKFDNFDINHLIKEPKKEEIKVTKKENNFKEAPTTVINAYANTTKLMKSIDKSEKEAKSTMETLTIADHSELMDKSKKLALILNGKTKEVIELSKQGLDTTEIAKKLGIGKGEIDLILSMKK